MHVYYKFGLLLIFILSVSTCYTRAAPATNQSSSTYDDDWDDDYDDYYDENEGNHNNNNNTTPSGTEAHVPPHVVAHAVVSMDANNRLMPTATAATTKTTTWSPQFKKIELPKRSNHVLEPSCPKACLCLEDYKYVQCSNAGLTHVPSDMPSTALIIDLSQNRISELRAEDFANCSKVREINLSGNALTTLDKEVFEGLWRLLRVRLDSNRLTHIDPNTFTGAPDLSTLDLSNNSIVLSDNSGSFLNQPNLLEFACRNCSWSAVFDETFANMSALTSLRLDQNDFNKKINTKAFTPLRNLIKLKLPELDQTSVQELCNLLKSIDNISFKHFDISCFELVLGASYNESLILATDPPYQQPATPTTTIGAAAAASAEDTPEVQSKQSGGTQQNRPKMTEIATSSNLTLPSGDDDVQQRPTILTAGILATASPTNGGAAEEGKEKAYQVPISQEAINIMLLSIMLLAILGIIIAIICRKDVGGIKTKCCRTRKPEPKDQVHPAEEIPLNKLA